MKKIFLVGALALLAFLLAIGALIVRERRDVELQPREEQVYDDFGFSVLSAQRSGGRCAVELRIVNHAKRVPFTLDCFRVRLADSRGEKYLEEVELATKPRKELAAGESVVETHVFELPNEAQGLVLELCFGPIPDMLDWLLDGKRTWRLP